ncbi:MAG TPA: site-specific integrase [Blastocatellia bacterium]|nr:site-specific integrase [Blastocatellia bacterium]
MTYCLDDLHERFVRERIYLQNVSDETVYFYRQAWRAFRRTSQKDKISQEDLTEFLIQTKQRGAKAVTINTYSRALNAFFNWAHQNNHLPERYRISKLKEDQPALKTLSEAHLKAVLSYRPKVFSQERLHTVLCLLIDTGVRIDEALTLEPDRVDFDNLLLTVKGKGGKERIIPFSLELRKILYRYIQKHPGRLVFATKQGTKLDYNTVKVDYYELCEKLGLKDRGFHRFRHTFAIQHIRYGGSLFGLQKILGHADLSVTRRYVELQTEDLTREHKKASLLARLK